MEVCILAGGLSTRMGRNKALLRLGGKTLLTHIRQAAGKLGLPIRVIRRDLVPRCGPLGGIYTALKTSGADAVLFLACDMPFVSEALLARLLKEFHAAGRRAVFTTQKSVAGFPLVLGAETGPLVEQLILEKRFSLQNLALKSGAKRFRPGRTFLNDLRNANTPDDWAGLRKEFAKKS